MPDAGSEPWADQVEPPPPEGVQGFAPDVPVAFQETLKLLLVGADVGIVNVTPPATVQLVPVWLVTETLPVVGLMLTELPVVESWKLQVPSTDMVLWARRAPALSIKTAANSVRANILRALSWRRDT